MGFAMAFMVIGKYFGFIREGLSKAAIKKGCTNKAICNCAFDFECRMNEAGKKTTEQAYVIQSKCLRKYGYLVEQNGRTDFFNFEIVDVADPEQEFGLPRIWEQGGDQVKICPVTYKKTAENMNQCSLYYNAVASRCIANGDKKMAAFYSNAALGFARKTNHE